MYFPSRNFAFLLWMCLKIDLLLVLLCSGSWSWESSLVFLYIFMLKMQSEAFLVVSSCFSPIFYLLPQFHFVSQSPRHIFFFLTAFFTSLFVYANSGGSLFAPLCWFPSSFWFFIKKKIVCISSMLFSANY